MRRLPLFRGAAPHRPKLPPRAALQPCSTSRESVKPAGVEPGSGASTSTDVRVAVRPPARDHGRRDGGASDSPASTSAVSDYGDASRRPEPQKGEADPAPSPSGDHHERSRQRSLTVKPWVVAKRGFVGDGSMDQYLSCFKSAGTAFYIFKDGELHVLMTVVAKRLNFLGGKRQLRDGGAPAATAAREAHEESHGVLDEQTVLRLLSAPDCLRAFEEHGQYVFFLCHLPDAWDAPDRCAAKLAAGEGLPAGRKNVGLKWVPLSKLLRGVNRSTFSVHAAMLQSACPLPPASWRSSQ